MIEVRNLTKSYGRKSVLKDISFTIDRGQSVGLIGCNGAGKSTTLKILTGFLKQDGGQVSVANMSPLTRSKKLMKMIGYLPETSPVYEEMNACEFLSFLAKVRLIQQPERALERVRKICHLESVWAKPMTALSKGYRHRVALAQALLHDPDILILDEPMDGLDPLQKEESKELIKGMLEKKTVLICTHNLEDLPSLCSRVLMLNHGELVMDCGTDEIKDHGELMKLFKSKL